MQPTVQARFANPLAYENQFYLDFQCRCDQPGKQVFGINMRYFYDGGIFKALKNSVLFSSFQGGYGLGWGLGVLPAIGNSASRIMFNTVGPAVYVNASVGLLSPRAEPVILDDWATLFTVVTEYKSSESSPACPPFILDKKFNPDNGGFLIGSQGLVITLKAEAGTANKNGIAMDSQPCTVHVEQFNWDYAGDRIRPPFGLPSECQ